ncbi:class I SAM-dependent methyltransferase [Clostridium estertheticum]|nr:class I SAM-dependent methyltransferase [Clostridium estertheticum]WLC81998.1 class I SAM-dependent methyltransferase [Clostridium estertheticum]
MMNYVVESYENYKEEKRLTTNNARKVEFLTTIRAFENIFPKNAKILDCASGTGIYAFFLAEKGYDLTATDITPRHIEYINNELNKKTYKIQTAILDATDLSIFENETFDIVLNMGPFYHLTDMDQREKCMQESLRVLKKGGLLVRAYISRYFVFPYVSTSDSKYLNEQLGKQLYETGTLNHDDPNCFWTDTYYASPNEMEKYYNEKSIEILDHFAQDGISPMLRKVIDSWNETQFKTWCDYHYASCREKTTIGASNHVIIIGRK